MRKWSQSFQRIWRSFEHWQFENQVSFSNHSVNRTFRWIIIDSDECPFSESLIRFFHPFNVIYWTLANTLIAFITTFMMAILKRIAWMVCPSSFVFRRKNLTISSIINSSSSSRGYSNRSHCWQNRKATESQRQNFTLIPCSFGYIFPPLAYKASSFTLIEWAREQKRCLVN